jgi:hypothetical protein
MKKLLTTILGINLESKVHPEIADQLSFTDLNGVREENESNQETYELNPIKQISENLLSDSNWDKEKSLIAKLDPKSLKEFDAEDAGIILYFLLEKQDLQTAQDFISKIDTSNLPENTHFVILRIISDLQNVLSADQSLQILTSLINAGFNAGAFDEENKADVLKIFSQQSKNPDHLESNSALIKKLIQTGKVKGYDNPEQAGILSDIAQKVIQGIDNKTLILASLAQEENRQNPQFSGNTPNSEFSIKRSSEISSYMKVAPEDLLKSLV